MSRAFGTVEDCVQDGVQSACGSFPSASIADVFAAILHRRQCFFDSDGNIVRFVDKENWKREARRLLFTSQRIGVVRDTLGSSQFCITKDAVVADWYIHFAGHQAKPEKAVKSAPPRKGKAQKEPITADTPRETKRSTEAVTSRTESQKQDHSSSMPPKKAVRVCPPAMHRPSLLDSQDATNTDMNLVSLQESLDISGSFKSLESRELKFPGM